MYSNGVKRAKTAEEKREKERMQKRLIWVDCEMTGLEVDTCRLIEIAVVITEGDLSIVEEYPSSISIVYTLFGSLIIIWWGILNYIEGAGVLGFRRWYPDVYAKSPIKRAEHRAIDDIRESIKELQYYQQAIFKNPAHVTIPFYGDKTSTK
uniref:Oligoribonuclease, mitochondrial-like n=1 Tax=Saccoglossus kowalevskii TaxID=10224 RepID=A0ABM0M7W8_SACKO|nr:PREDICTED: oligoribonuclease, mitochondrial-like [Saccoglossus kowalevskii]